MKKAGGRDAQQRRRGTLILLSVLMALLQTCRLAGPGMPTPVLVSTDSFILAWDPASPAPGSETAAWRVYSRPHGTAAWTELLETAADEGTRCTLTRDQLGAGDFDIAVSTVDTLGRESALHCSTDPDAWPTGGWYLLWR